MELPNAERAIVDEEKIRDYLLAPLHPVGRYKAQFFARLGYRDVDWERLRGDLLTMAMVAEVHALVPTAHGVKYVARGIMRSANGQSTELVSVWIVRSGGSRPRLITAYPGRET